MYSKSIALFSLIAGAFAQGGLMVSSPSSLVECQPRAIKWSGGTAPYFLSILPGGQTGAEPLEQFPETSATSYVWNVNIAAGTSITLQITDSEGNINYSAPITIQSGVSSSCVGQPASVTTGSATAAPTITSAPAAPVLPSGLYGFSQSGISAFPSGSYSLISENIFGIKSYAIYETLSAASSGEASAVTGILQNGPNYYVLSLDGSGAASTADVYASCSVSGSSAVCVAEFPTATTTFTAPFEENTADAAASGLVRRKLRFERH